MSRYWYEEMQDRLTISTAEAIGVGRLPIGDRLKLEDAQRREADRRSSREAEARARRLDAFYP